MLTTFLGDEEAFSGNGDAILSKTTEKTMGGECDQQGNGNIKERIRNRLLKFRRYYNEGMGLGEFSNHRRFSVNR